MSKDKTQEAVDQVFKRYDLDGNKVLDVKEMQMFLNQLAKCMGRSDTLDEQQVKKFIASIDISKDGVVQKEQLYNAFKNHMI